MTKIEYGKCEKLMEEAIRKAKQSDEEYMEAGRHYANMDSVRQETEQALATLGFKNDRMKELSKLL